MNILFFLTPKALCSYIDDGCTLRQAMERMENSGYTALPVLDKDGGYCGVLTEGDLLWAVKRLCVMDHPVRVDTRIEDLVLVAADQNFVPVIDDKNAFIGIVTRSSILKYCLDRYFSREYELVGAR